MRIVLVGGSEFTEITARDLIAGGHEVVVVERNRARIDALSEDLSCSFVHGDGTRPTIQREAGVATADVLLCAMDDDRANILASVVGRHLGAPRIVVAIASPDLEDICRELGFDDVVVPARTVGRELRDAVLGVRGADPARALRNGARLFTHAIDADDPRRSVGALELPPDARAVWLHRGDRVVPIDADTTFEEGDDVVVLTGDDRLRDLADHLGGDRNP